MLSPLSLVSRDVFFRELSAPPEWCDNPPWHVASHRHSCAIPHSATYRAIIVPHPIKTSTKEFCDTIATSIARYEKYRCWASKHLYNTPFCNISRDSYAISPSKKFRKIPAPIKIKSALPSPQTQNTPPPPKRGILWTWRFSYNKNAEILGAHKIGATISSPRIADTNFMDTRIFLEESALRIFWGQF